MNKKFKLTTRFKLLIGFGSILIAIIVALVVFSAGFSSIRESHAKVTRSLETIVELTQLRSDENRLRALTLELIMTRDAEERIADERVIKERIAEVDTRINSIELLMAEYPDQISVFRQIRKMMETFRENRNQQFDLIQKGKFDDALNFASTVQNPLYEDIRQTILDLEKSLVERNDQLLKENAANETLLMTVLIALGIAIILIALFFIIRMMILLRKISAEIINGVNILGTSAAEILTTVTEVSTGATETSTAVSETTTTIEEIRQTALVATQRAQSVLESSQRASEAAENGKESVHQTIEGMSRINIQMNLIAESVVKLSEQNRSIGEITASVNDIADQSNLLAVNAAIEAAKAGEQGRGFAVVAQEIRSLAEQSKQATGQVKEILTEIQKAVNLAVMATEQGSKAVESGSKLALKSGEMIEILAESVSDAVQSVLQISTSSQQQMAGMDQIVPAMENIKQASAQNVIGTRQTQTAAHDLNELGQNLKNILEKYNV